MITNQTKLAAAGWLIGLVVYGLLLLYVAG
jgi:hypothetical protein